VEALKKNPLFRNVDSMPADRRKILVVPMLADPENHFALEIDLAGNPYAPVARRAEKSDAPDAPPERLSAANFRRRPDPPSNPSPPETW
jgi:hypothetical protein